MGFFELGKVYLHPNHKKHLIDHLNVSKGERIMNKMPTEAKMKLLQFLLKTSVPRIIDSKRKNKDVQK